MTNKKESSSFGSWAAMKRRAISRSEWQQYYAHIDADPRWSSFEEFHKDMGEKPRGTSLDRIDNSKGYWKENCRWATPLEQVYNRTNTLRHTEDGLTLTMPEWSAHLGVPETALRLRVGRYGSVHKRKPPPRMATIGGQTETLADWAKLLGMSYMGAQYRLDTYGTLEKI